MVLAMFPFTIEREILSSFLRRHLPFFLPFLSYLSLLPFTFLQPSIPFQSILDTFLLPASYLRSFQPRPIFLPLPLALCPRPFFAIAYLRRCLHFSRYNVPFRRNLLATFQWRGAEWAAAPNEKGRTLSSW